MSEKPFLQVVRGDATPEEIAAIVAVIAARAAAVPAEAPPAPTSQWSERSRLVRRPLHPGPGAWRGSALR
jgi:hypothetical protein